MTIKDCIYGDFKLEPILLDLINCDAIQRLKKIHQGGASYLVNPLWNVNRYDHSIGTMLLVRLLHGSLEEQIASLLHDISHTAFSHVVDFALDNKEEDYHEEIFDKIVESSQIPEILNSYGYDYKDILYDESKYTILEKSAPSLCADRIDYTLRDMFNYGFITNKEIKFFLESLVIVNGEIMINSMESALWFVDTYYKEVIDFFLHPLNIYAYNRLSKAIKLGLELNVITLDDLLSDDEYVFNMLNNSNCENIKNLINSLNNDVKVIEDKNNYDIHQLNKIRLIDPNVLINNNIYKASQKSKLISNLNENALIKSKQGTYVKIL